MCHMNLTLECSMASLVCLYVAWHKRLRHIEPQPLLPRIVPYRHVISNVQVLSPRHWHFDSVTLGSFAP